MKRISKAQEEEIATVVSAIQKLEGELTEAVEEYNSKVEEARNEVKAAHGRYNEKLAELKGIYENIAEEARNYYEERNERWQDSDAGVAYSNWCDDLEAVDLDEHEIDWPEELEAPNYPDVEDIVSLEPNE